MAQSSIEGWGSNAAGWFGSLVKEGMSGYIAVETAKASNAGAQAATQNATFDSPNVAENPTAQNGQTLGVTANGGALQSFTQNPTAIYVAGGLALVGTYLLLKRRR